MIAHVLFALPMLLASAPSSREGTVQFIGNATMLIRYGGLNILTDPNFVHQGDEVPLGYGLHATRLTNPALELDELPPIDAVVLSHFHGDHFDPLVARALDKNIPIITTPQASEQLLDEGFRAPHALQTWESTTITRGNTQLRVTAMPGKHGPGLLNYALPEVMGSMLEFLDETGEVAWRFHISGDTLMTELLEEIPRRYGDIDLAAVHLGGTRVMGILVTMDAEQGVEWMKLIPARTVLPIHYDDYDRFKSSLEDFREEAEKEGVISRVHFLKRGDVYTFTTGEETPAIGSEARER